MDTAQRDSGNIELDSISYWSMYGPPMLGLFIGLLLQGAFCFVAFAYFRLHPRDPWHTRALVVVLLVFTWIDTIAGCVRVVKTGVVHPGDRDFYYDAAARPEIWVQRLFYGLSVNLCSLFMWIRMIIFSRALVPIHGRPMQMLSWFVTFGTGALLLLGVAATFGLTITLASLDSFLALKWSGKGIEGALKFWYNLQGISLTLMDFCIMVLMLVMIRVARTGFEASEKVLDSMTIIVLRTGGIGTIAQFLQVLTFNLTISTWGDMTPMMIAQFLSFSVCVVLIEPRSVQKRFFKKQMEVDESSGQAAEQRPTTQAAADGCANCVTNRRLGYPAFSTATTRAEPGAMPAVMANVLASRRASAGSGTTMTLRRVLLGRDDEGDESEGEGEAKAGGGQRADGAIELPVLLHGSGYSVREWADAAEPSQTGAAEPGSPASDRDTVSMREMLESHPFW